MKLSANIFAKALWIAAIVLAIAEWLPYLTMSYPINYPSEPLRYSLIFQTLGQNVMYAGGLAALGAIVHLLGEIRDAVTRPSL